MMREHADILVAIDPEGRADLALAAARRIATRFDARVNAVHVVERHGGFWTRAPEHGEEWLREHGEEVIAKAWEATGGGEGLRPFVRAGHPVREITACAQELGCELLVLGRHGKGHRDPLLGGTAQRLLLKRPCAMLVQKQALEGEGYARILVGTDLSAESLGAVRVARDWARRMGSKLHVAHVFEPPDFAYDPTVAMPTYSIDSVREGVARDFHARLEEFDFAGVDHEVHDLEGTAASELMGLVHRTECDLLVVGGHGHGALEQILLGTTAESLVRNASCAVLVT